MYLCIAFEKSTSVKLKKFGSLAQLNRASDYGSEGYRFESCRSHKKKESKQIPFFVFSNKTPFASCKVVQWKISGKRHIF